MKVKNEGDLIYIRYKLDPTYYCYLCKWEGGSEDIGREHKTDEKGSPYDSLYCPNCTNYLLHTEYQKVYYG